MPGLVARDPDGATGVPEAASSTEAVAVASPAHPTVAPHTGGLPADGEALDAWLRAELSRLHDDVLAEPVPLDMLRLLQEAAGRKG